MEKPGMGRGHRYCRTGLLVLIPLIVPLFFSPRLFGQSGEEPVVLVESFPERPVLDGSWRISILVDHPVPEDVTVIPPDLPSSLTFAQSRKETRLIRTSPEEGTRWTLVEFLFVPQRTGTISLGAFEVSVRGFRTTTRKLQTYVIAQEGMKEEYHPRLAWDTLPAALTIGEDAELILRILGGDPGKALRPAPFRGTAPAEALLEELPLTKEDLDQGRVLRLRLIPLEGTRVSIEPFTLHFDTLTLDAPAISIRLNPAAPRKEPVPGNAVPPVPEPLPEAVPPQKPAPAFPEIREEPFPPFRRAYEETLKAARKFWSMALYAEALGELRRGERDLLGGPNLVSTRRAAEQSLGLSTTEDEKWRPRNFFLLLIILSFCLLILAIWLPKKSVTSLFLRGYKVVILLLIGILGLGIAGLASSRGGTGKTLQESAVLRACAAYRVPDSQGAISARWLEGQPVRVRAASKPWAYAESADGDAGWVRQDNLVFY
ncbi:SH3 domain-containing protein [Treponema primitia]|uniref:SH3 domain-containing protein n=1 Tax=Treponema primitia TaxID=88058 RepID=UPI001E368F34|nr:SH3 domain-containing protein [Treponema primitia]